jgi:hypothetical protein
VGVKSDNGLLNFAAKVFEIYERMQCVRDAAEPGIDFTPPEAPGQ